MATRRGGLPANPQKPDRVKQLETLLREAVKIVHCHSRNLNKDWLSRARAALR